MTKISELRAGMNDVSIKGEVAELSEPRAVQTKYGARTVADATIDDGSGTIRLSLWGDQISLVRQGNNVEVNGAYVKEWNGQLQLGVGKSGEIKVV